MTSGSGDMALSLAGHMDGDGQGAEEEQPLPVLRPDLEIVAGPPAADGAPTYTIHDPVPRRFSKVGWAEAMVLERLRRPTTLAALKLDLERTTSIRASCGELQALVQKAVAAGLTTLTMTMPVDALVGRAAQRRAGGLKWLLRNYLYFRIPLLRPDAFLGRTLALARIFASGPALALYAVLGLIGLGFLVRHWDAYTRTFPYFFNALGMFWYGASIICIKVVHEFAHAYTAKSVGVRVPVMGVALIVMWPVAFCDVTDAWKVRDRRARFRIGAAGIATECVIAGLALFGWGVSPPGVFNSVCFVASSVSLASTLIVNLNPAMSFDGYYMLMDLWGVDNLRPRAFAATRWLYRKLLLGVDDPPPEKGLSGRRSTAFVLYSVYAWIYRLVLYLGIAVFVYHAFTKTLGIVLFSVEVWWFVAKPVAAECAALAGMRSRVRLNPALATLLLLLGAGLAYIALPLSRSMALPAVIAPEFLQVVYAPASGTVKEAFVEKGGRVAPGAPVVLLESRELDTDLARLREQLAILEMQRDNMLLGVDDRAYLPQKVEEIGRAAASLEALRKDRDRLSVSAQTGGEVIWWDDTLYPGRPVHKDQVLGRIVDPGSMVVRAFVDEDRVGDFSLGQAGTFRPASQAEAVPCTIQRLSPVRTENMEHLALTSLGRGVIPVAQDAAGRMRMLESWYEVELAPTPDSPSLVPGQSGTVRLSTKPKSLLLSWLRRAYRVVLRESGL